MSFALDPQVAEVLGPWLEAAAQMARPPIGDVELRRELLGAGQAVMEAAYDFPTDVRVTDFVAESDDGSRIALRWYTRNDEVPGSAVLYLHGGGMIMGSLDIYHGTVARYVSDSGVPILAVGYRYAPEHPGFTPVKDAYAGLEWLADNSEELGFDRSRIAVMGDSAGGGIAAGLALLARDRHGPALAKQILIYPMLDDRNTIPDPELAPFAAWTYEDNMTGWGALLSDSVGGPNVSPYVAPARMQDARGLPEVYLEVGELDIFRDEGIAFALRTLAAGVSTELHVHPGVTHGWEIGAPQADVSQRSRADRIRAVQRV
jgi:acetyl esterase/lipase